MKYDLDSLSRKELEKLRAEVEKALAGLNDRERKAALDAARKAAKEHGFKLEELTGGAGKAKAKVAAKYRNPADSSQTWSGRGRKPQWIKDAEKAGTDLATLAV